MGILILKRDVNGSRTGIFQAKNILVHILHLSLWFFIGYWILKTGLHFYAGPFCFFEGYGKICETIGAPPQHQIYSEIWPT